MTPVLKTTIINNSFRLWDVRLDLLGPNSVALCVGKDTVHVLVHFVLHFPSHVLAHVDVHIAA